MSSLALKEGREDERREDEGPEDEVIFMWFATSCSVS